MYCRHAAWRRAWCGLATVGSMLCILALCSAHSIVGEAYVCLHAACWLGAMRSSVAPDIHHAAGQLHTLASMQAGHHARSPPQRPPGRPVGCSRSRRRTACLGAALAGSSARCGLPAGSHACMHNGALTLASRARGLAASREDAVLTLRLPNHCLLPNTPFQCASWVSCTEQEAEGCCVEHGSCQVLSCWSALCRCRLATPACCMLTGESQTAALRALTSSRCSPAQHQGAPPDAAPLLLC